MWSTLMIGKFILGVAEERGRRKQTQKDILLLHIYAEMQRTGLAGVVRERVVSSLPAKVAARSRDHNQVPRELVRSGWLMVRQREVGKNWDWELTPTGLQEAVKLARLFG